VPVSHGRSCSQPHSSIPTSRRRSPLPWRTSSDPRRVEVVLGQGERFLDAQPGAKQRDDHRLQPPAVTVRVGVAHDRDDLIHGGWVSGVAGCPCCAVDDRRGSRVGSPASGVGPPHRARPWSSDLLGSDSGYGAGLHRHRPPRYRLPR
jgi:hypothetical protein